jgi:hypothetical protein
MAEKPPDAPNIPTVGQASTVLPASAMASTRQSEDPPLHALNVPSDPEDAVSLYSATDTQSTATGFARKPGGRGRIGKLLSKGRK